MGAKRVNSCVIINRLDAESPEKAFGGKLWRCRNHPARPGPLARSFMIRIHPTADVSSSAQIGDGAQIWHQAQVREGANIGRNCIVGKGVYVDFGVHIGDNCKLQNGAFIYHGATLADGVFVGPGAVLTNDRQPRAINPDGTLKTADDWQVGPIQVGYGASIGAGCIVLPGVTVGRFAMTGAGAVVTRDVPDHGLAVGAPARLAGYVCSCGARLVIEETPAGRRGCCTACDRAFDLTSPAREGAQE
jgi:acetyltransferase-like isoleucine patch superfamily enzyme